jgi:opacity protein-like surface antigen
MRKSILIALLSTVAVPAFAADMQVKAPIREAVPYADWSGIYVGVAAGFGWGREKLDTDVGAINNLFGTSAARVFEGPVLIAPGFDLGTCVIPDCNKIKQNGFMAGGFAGGQKQLGNWVLGLEVSFDATGMKKRISADTVDIEAVTRIAPVQNAILPSFLVPVSGFNNLPVLNGQVVVPDQTITVNSQQVTVPGQTLAVQPVQVVIPAQNITIPGQNAPVTVTVQIAGQNVVGTINPNSTGLGPITLTFPNPLPIGPDNISIGPFGPFSVPISGDVNVSVPAQTVAAGGTAAVAGQTVAIPGQTVTVPGQVIATAPRTITVNGQSITLPGQVLPLHNGVVSVPGQNIVIPQMNVVLPGLGLPVASLVNARVTRTVDLETKVDEIADFRGKIGLTNVFFGPNVLLYATGGAAVGHFTKSLTLSQTVQGLNSAGQNVGAPRVNDFTSSTGDTRLGWVIGAGLDWKLTPNLILGALYRHHEFPKGTVAFSDSTNSVGFGTSRQTVDSIQGRLSVLFPIQ